MKPVLLLLLPLIIIALIVASIPLQGNSFTLYNQDSEKIQLIEIDFENDTVGSRPTYIDYGSCDNSYISIQVSDKESHNSEKSLNINVTREPSRRCDIIIGIDKNKMKSLLGNYKYIVLELALKINKLQDDINMTISLGCKNCPPATTTPASFTPVYFCSQGHIYAKNFEIGSYEYGKWFTLKIILDIRNANFSVWKEGEMLRGNLLVERSSGGAYNLSQYIDKIDSAQIIISKNKGNMELYIDDLKIYLSKTETIPNTTTTTPASTNTLNATIITSTTTATKTITVTETTTSTIVLPTTTTYTFSTTMTKTTTVTTTKTATNTITVTHNKTITSTTSEIVRIPTTKTITVTETTTKATTLTTTTTVTLAANNTSAHIGHTSSAGVANTTSQLVSILPNTTKLVISTVTVYEEPLVTRIASIISFISVVALAVLILRRL